MKGKLKRLREEQIEEFNSVIRKIFDEFVAIDYSAEGNSTFYDFIKVEEIKKRYKYGNFFLVYEIDTIIVGAIELRDYKHISLLFVDKEYQGKGIATSLFNKTKEYIKTNDSSIKIIEVNSSPYAKEIYKKMGFTEKSDLKEQNGIKYYELEYEIE